jgi:ABC-type microcin C transport system permease subunit YejE
VMASPGRRGVSAVVLVAGHIVTQCIPAFLVLATAHLGTAIVIEATLGFHGIGITPPTASWGNMLRRGRRQHLQASLVAGGVSWPVDLLDGVGLQPAGRHFTGYPGP